MADIVALIYPGSCFCVAISLSLEAFIPDSKKFFYLFIVSLVALPGVYYASLLPDEGNGWRINGCIGAGDIDWSSIIWRWIFGL